jgi:hypothetical protein
MSTCFLYEFSEIPKLGIDKEKSLIIISIVTGYGNGNGNSNGIGYEDKLSTQCYAKQSFPDNFSGVE